MGELFDSSNFDHDKVGHLAYIVNSPSWLDFFEPMLNDMVNSCHALLADPSLKRKNDRPDDFLRGQIVTIRNLLEIPHFVIAEAREREDAARKSQEETKHYAGRAQDGSMGPMGFREPSEDEF